MGPGHVKSLFLAAAIAGFGAVPVRAQLTSCETFDRANAQAPLFVRNYLERSRGSFVRACGGGAHPQYYGASSVARDGNLCRYSEYELNLVNTNPPRLERASTPQQTYIRTTNSTCPSPVLTGYTATNDLPQEIAEHLIRILQDATSSLASFDGAMSGVSDGTVVRRMRRVVLQGKGSRLTVLSVTMHRNFGVWKDYGLDVADPDRSDRFYFVTVSSWFGQSYLVSSVSAGIY
jgi:hypothetical protein